MIRKGGKSIGRVVPHADGGWVAVIGKSSVRANDPVVAFKEIAAREFGYGNAADLAHHNRQVRSVRNAHRRSSREFAREFMRSDVLTQIKMIDKLFGFEPTGGRQNILP
jgi:hypothetical protein